MQLLIEKMQLPIDRCNCRFFKSRLHLYISERFSKAICISAYPYRLIPLMWVVSLSIVISLKKEFST